LLSDKNSSDVPVESLSASEARLSKRSLEEDDVNMEDGSSNEANKRLCTSPTPATTENSTLTPTFDSKKILNFPIPNERGIGCIVKVSFLCFFFQFL